MMPTNDVYVVLHLQWLTTREARSCLSVCLKTFESLDIRTPDVSLGILFKFVYEGHRVKVKFTGAKKVENYYSQGKISIGNNSGSIKHRAMKFACSMELRLWRIEWCDRHLCHV